MASLENVYVIKKGRIAYVGQERFVLVYEPIGFTTKIEEAQKIFNTGGDFTEFDGSVILWRKERGMSISKFTFEIVKKLNFENVLEQIKNETKT